MQALTYLANAQQDKRLDNMKAGGTPVYHEGKKDPRYSDVAGILLFIWLLHTGEASCGQLLLQQRVPSRSLQSAHRALPRKD